RQYIYYESMRNINFPRPLGIPNPMAYQRLCECLSENWDKIQKHFETTTKDKSYKVSRIHIRKLNNSGSLFEMNYDNWRSDGSPELDLLIGKRYIVKADISNCFPSIYTHSLPWALVGKATSKTNRNKSEWFNKIDHYVQNIKNGETHGLIIGPHTSNLLSEIILCSIDKKLNKWDYIRNIDDFTCYVETYDKAQRFLVELSEQLREFDLVLNHKKTEIIELPVGAMDT
ncbi:RNA-directed DNA polymerase, partial [Clostridium perfringens]|uniref:RNA-directed DNA polymerase n=1 Tax=Clostridium perfringens TaxID=1502 RepID=UPI002245A11A